jgi:hypothetical protein
VIAVAGSGESAMPSYGRFVSRRATTARQHIVLVILDS